MAPSQCGELFSVEEKLSSAEILSEMLDGRRIILDGHTFDYLVLLCKTKEKNHTIN